MPHTLVTGIRPCEALIGSKFAKHINLIRVDKSKTSRPIMSRILEQARQKQIRIQDVDRAYFKRIQHINHQDIAIEMAEECDFIADSSELEQSIIDSQGNPMFFMILDGVTDVRNFGGIIRTAECLGCSGVIVAANHSAPINESCIRTSAGAVFSLPIYKFDHVLDAIYTLQANDFTTYAANEKANSSSTQTKFNYRSAFVLGSEEKGISKSILQATDEQISIPMQGEVASLNVGVSAAIFTHEFVRQHS